MLNYVNWGSGEVSGASKVVLFLNLMFWQVGVTHMELGTNIRVQDPPGSYAHLL